MRFALSEDQRQLEASLKGLLGQVCTLDAVRAVAASDFETRIEIDGALSGMGLGGVLVAEPLGGLGLGLLEAVIAQDAFGAALAPVDFVAHAVMAPIALRTLETSALSGGWSERIAAGTARVAVAPMERSGAREGAGFNSVGDELTGKALFVFGVMAATHILVLCESRRIHIVDLGSQGVSIKHLDTIDRTRVFSEVQFDRAPGLCLCDDERAGRAMDAAISAGRVALAADTLGAAQTMLDKAVAYSLERKQFGRPIGSFQAVKHMCAEMAAALEPCRALVWQAAHAFDQGSEEAALMACLANSHLAEVGTFVAKTATEVHGGMGFTDLLGLHHWFKRIGANRQLLGGPERVREEAARLQGWVN
ncbi:MAG: acyl-CoA dehydrogenase [Pseudomonadota bacterium]